MDLYERRQREKGQVRETEDVFGSALPLNTNNKSIPNSK